MPSIDVDKIIDLGQNCFIVPSENHPDVSYVLDMCARYCSCPQGRCSGPCKHKLLVSSYKNISSFEQGLKTELKLIMCLISFI